MKILASLLSLLACGIASASTATLSWDPNPSTDAVTSYNVYQASGTNTAFLKIGSTPVTTFQAAGLTNGVAYRWYVTAVNATGESTPSSTVTSTYNAVPKSPTALTVAAMSSTRIDLHWQDNSDNESGFVVQRAVGTGPYASIATLPANAVSFINGGLLPRKNYLYRVYAFNGYGNSIDYAGPAGARTFNH